MSGNNANSGNENENVAEISSNGDNTVNVSGSGLGASGLGGSAMHSRIYRKSPADRGQGRKSLAKCGPMMKYTYAYKTAMARCLLLPELIDVTGLDVSQPGRERAKLKLK